VLRAAIGHGGMGTVWRASDSVLNRDVAVKEVVLPPGLAPADRDAMYQRTLREARAAAGLSHPAIVQVYDVVTDGGRPWIVMELLQSRSLAEMVVDDGPLAPRAVAKIGIALLGALEVAHAAGVLHRDVKPANVLICSDGRCVLTDFGVARMPTDAELTSPGMVLGSPHFIAPERAVGARFGPQSDLFSLGVTLYTAVEGRPPFDKPNPFETMRAVVEEPPTPAVRAGALAGVLYGLLEKDPQRRWEVTTARSVLRELMSGPLASNAATQGTDPYAVVRPPPWTPPATAHATGAIGGRAFIPPDVPLEQALRRARQANGAATAAAPPEGGIPRRSGAVARLASGRRRVPRWAQVLVAAGVVVGLAVAVAAAMGLFRSAPPVASAGANLRSASPAPLIAVQEYRDERGFMLNVPKDWAKKPSRSYVDYVDPVDGSRRVRINVESAGGSARAFAEVAENGLRRNTAVCAAPYRRIGLREDVTLAGRAAADLEYSCGSGDQMRHGIWRFTVLNGKAYHFYLTVPDSRFTESRVIFEEMARSFRFE
jgi:eukaryotic-like serine/threonine-protein kinase